MGNDGGDIPKRKQLVKDKKKEQRPNMQSIAMGRSRFCNLTNQKLKQPLAIDKLGCIYNYENIVAYLIKKNLPQKYAYIKKLTDIKKVIIDRAPVDSNNYIACPITNLQYNGFNKFIGLWTCGHVLSRKAYKQIVSEDKKCIICETPYQDKDIIDLNLEGERLQVMRKVQIQKKKKNAIKNLQAQKRQEKQVQDLGKAQKKVKTDVHVNGIDRLGGQFRDVIRQRSGFKQIFKHGGIEQWKLNTYTAKKQ